MFGGVRFVTCVVDSLVVSVIEVEFGFVVESFVESFMISR